MLKFLTRRIILYTVVILFIVPVLIFLALGLSSRNKNKDNTAVENVKISETESASEVPLPSEESVVRTFCALIDEGKIQEAVGMMNIGSDSEKREWGVTFNSFSSFELKNIQKSQIDESGNSYEVDIDVTLKEGKNSFGWVNGINKRWINLVEYEKGKYKILDIATGP